jgi:hypothetical protein
MRVTSIVLFALGAACSSTAGVRSSPSTVAAYQAVRSGERYDAAARDVRFCAGPGVVVAERTRARPTDDWLTQFRDEAVAENVRGTLRADPALAGSAITANVRRGAVHLDGSAPSDAAAASAIARALDVDGVVLVEARLFTPQTAAPPGIGTARWCG